MLQETSKRVRWIIYQLAPFYKFNVNDDALPQVLIDGVSRYDPTSNIIYLRKDASEDIGVIAEESGHYLRRQARKDASDPITDEFFGGLSRGLVSGLNAWRSSKERERAMNLVYSSSEVVDDATNILEESPDRELYQQTSDYLLLMANYMGHELAQRVLETSPLEFLSKLNLISMPDEEVKSVIFDWLKTYAERSHFRS